MFQRKETPNSPHSDNNTRTNMLPEHVLWDVKVNACVEPRWKQHGTPHIWEVKQINATRSKTPWDVVCRIVIFRSVAVHFFIPKQLQIPIRTRLHSCLKKLRTIYPRVLKNQVDAYPHMSPKYFWIVVWKHLSGRTFHWNALTSTT